MNSRHILSLIGVALIIGTSIASTTASSARERHHIGHRPEFYGSSAAPILPGQPLSAGAPDEHGAAANVIGMASFYGRDHAGRRTADGHIFNPVALTAAHRNLPFGTKVHVTNLTNGRSVVVCISDRGPFIRGRIIDLSLGAARALDFVDRGVAKVKLERVPS